MDDKLIARRFLISVAASYAGGFLITFLIAYAFVSKGMTSLSLSTGQLVLLGLGMACLPAGTYTGFVIAGLKLIEKNKLTKGVMLAVCIFFPITLALLTLFGIIMIIPKSIQSVIKLIKG